MGNRCVSTTLRRLAKRAVTRQMQRKKRSSVTCHGRLSLQRTRQRGNVVCPLHLWSYELSSGWHKAADGATRHLVSSPPPLSRQQSTLGYGPGTLPQDAGAPVSPSHNRTVKSSDAEAISLASGEKATPSTNFVWPSEVFSSSPATRDRPLAQCRGFAFGITDGEQAAGNPLPLRPTSGAGGRCARAGVHVCVRVRHAEAPYAESCRDCHCTSPLWQTDRVCRLKHHQNRPEHCVQIASQISGRPPTA